MNEAPYLPEAHNFLQEGNMQAFFFFLRLPYGAQGYVLKWEQCTLCERMEKDPA